MTAKHIYLIAKELPGVMMVTAEEMIALGKSRSDCHPTNIDTLVNTVRHPDEGDVVECGAYRCGATIAMAAAAPDRHIFAFDTFGGLPYTEKEGFVNFAETNFEEIKSVTDRFPNITLIRGRHEDTVPNFPARPLALLFMDSDHYGSHVVCLKHFWPMLIHGGLAVFHDIAFAGVQQAIDEHIPKNEIFTSGRFESSQNMGYVIKI